MNRYIVIACLSLLFSPLLLSGAEDSYIGKSLGTDFYSRIDQGRYTIRTKMSEKRLSEWKDANEFVAECRVGATEVFRSGVKLNADDIDALIGGNLEKIHDRVNPDFLANGYNTDALIRLSRCILDKHRAISDDNEKTIKNMEKVSMIGLYLDGSTENSDYDIVADIGAINRILFESPVTYNGTKNSSSNAFSDILSGNAKSLFTGETAPTLSGAVLSGGTTSGNTSSSNTLASELLLCPPDASNIMSDSGLLSDIEATLLSGKGNGSTKSGGLASSGSGNRDSASSEDDFSHTYPCSDVFCITIDFVSESTNLLTGGTPTSVEGIIKKNLDYVEQANATSLTPKYMTNNFFGFTFPSLNLPSLANIVVITSQKPQPVLSLQKNVKRDDAIAFDADLRCARLEAGLREDEKKENDFTEGVYMQQAGIDHLEWLTTDETQNATMQDRGRTFTGCTEKGILRGNTDTYESLSRDLTEIQVFTKSLTDGLNATIPGILSHLISTPQI